MNFEDFDFYDNSFLDENDLGKLKENPDIHAKELESLLRDAGKLENKHIKREPSHRIFVNRSFQLSDIKFFGFDMDHTLAVYKTEAFDLLTFNLAIERLIEIGYPSEIKKFEYDSKFAIRGLWFDKLYGNILKVDTFGNILMAVHGFKVLKGNEIYHYYPNKFLNYDENRICIQHTLYENPESYLVACVIHHFSTSSNYKCEDTVISSGDIKISYKSIFQDVREAIDFQYTTYKIQNIVIGNVEKYIVKDSNTVALLETIRENNAKAFLLTNSDYTYADKIMSYMIDEKVTGKNWRSYFDYIVVESHKPGFFHEGTTLKEINIEKGTKNIGTHSGPLLSDRVYAGGSCEVFSKLIGSRGKDVLYVGDHIFGDIIKSKKERAWHTFLIVPELSNELSIWHEKRELFREIELLNDLLSQMLVNYDSSSKECPNIKNVKQKLQVLLHEMDMAYSFFGSSFRSGSRQTYFASQVTRYADIYSSKCVNLLFYPFFYLFKAPPMLMPHESTVPHEEPFAESIIDNNNQHLIDRSSSNATVAKISK